jgi:hypothetical protein
MALIKKQGTGLTQAGSQRHQAALNHKRLNSRIS